LATASASVADDSATPTSVEDFERCFVYNRIPKPKLYKVKVYAADFYECRVMNYLQLLQQKNNMYYSSYTMFLYLNLPVNVILPR